MHINKIRKINVMIENIQTSLDGDIKQHVCSKSRVGQRVFTPSSVRELVQDIYSASHIAENLESSSITFGGLLNVSSFPLKVELNTQMYTFAEENNRSYKYDISSLIHSYCMHQNDDNVFR